MTNETSTDNKHSELCQFNYQAPKDLLKDKVILVTGAGDGIGKAAALSYAEHGATVILLGRTVEKLEAVYDMIEEKGFPQAAIIPTNLEVAGEVDFQRIATVIDDEFGQLDGLLHNAALLGELTLLEQYPLETFKQLMTVNVTAQFALTKATLPLLRTAKQASLVFTSSSVGRVGRAHWGAYAISKFATEGMMQTLADEIANTSNVRVNSLNPGGTRTAMRAFAYPGENPEKRRRPEAIMGTYLYLMGEDSSGKTGQAFNAQP